MYNSKPSVLERIEKVSGVRPNFIEGDVRDKALLTETMKQHNIEAVIHFAGLKAVGESVEKPLEYYDNNVNGTLVLVDAMRDAGVKPWYSALQPRYTAILQVCQSLKTSQQAQPTHMVVVN